MVAVAAAIIQLFIAYHGRKGEEHKRYVLSDLVISCYRNHHFILTHLGSHFLFAVSCRLAQGGQKQSNISEARKVKLHLFTLKANQ